MATGASTAVAVGGAFTGNVPAAGVGTMGMAAGGAVTIFGGKTGGVELTLNDNRRKGRSVR